VTLPRPILELAWAVHRGLFRMTGGRAGTEHAGTDREIAVVMLERAALQE
jgi:hypothetical protein